LINLIFKLNQTLIINFQAERLRADNIFEECYKIEEQHIREELCAGNLLLLTSLETKQQAWMSRRK